MNRRTFVRVSAATGLAVYAGGCGASGPASEPGTVRLAGGSFGFPSPFAYIASFGYTQMSYLYDTLLWKDSTGRMLPWLARRYRRSPDGLTYTFELRDGVKWHDGRPLTAADVAFTFEYFARQALGPLIVAQPFGVKGTQATGPLTVDVHLDIPTVTFLDSVAGAVPIIPKHVWSSIADAPRAQDRDGLVGTGPYRLASFTPGEGALLYTASRDYFLGRPYIRRIELRPVDDELTALRAGEIDVAETASEGVGDDALASFRADGAYGLLEGKGTFAYPLIFNLARGALKDVRVRRAIVLAIDRGAIVQRLLTGNGQPGNPGFLPPDHPFHAEVEQYAFDPGGAGRLLDEAGYARPGDGSFRRNGGGEQLSFGILTGNSPVPPVLDLLVQSLKAIGVELRPQSVDLPTLFGRQQKNADEIALSLYPGPGGTALNADPDTLRTFFSSKIKGRLQGAQGYVDAEFDGLAQRQLVTAREAERRTILANMQRIVARDLPALPLYYPSLFSVIRKRAFDQWYLTPGGFAGGLTGVFNKHVLITGAKAGLKVRSRP
ncbi:MAG: ABC transporter substrate-binding protein [Solirubrobacteraceae bacterium]